MSGGHTMVVVMEDHGAVPGLGQTVDDAAGEAFDKVARYLGLGYPGGPAIDRLAGRGRPGGGARSRGRCPATADFSFSGLKTAVVNHVRRHPDTAGRRRRGVVPGGGGRPARREAARRGRRRRRAARSCSAAGSRRTRGCARRWPRSPAATGRRRVPARRRSSAPTTGR